MDLENRVMVIPASHAKSKRLDSIPLNAMAILILEECDRNILHPFANPTTGKPYVSIKKSFKTLMDNAELDGVTAHVMRHTFASMLVQTHSLQTIGRLLRHSSTTVTEKYGHLSVRNLADSSDAISRQLILVASGEN